MRSPRHRWWALGSVIALVLVGGMAFLTAPAIASRYLSGHLPRDLGHRQVLTSVSTTPLAGRSQITMALSPRRATTAVNSVDGVWLPPGLIRAGTTLVGTGRLPHDVVPYGWRVQVESPRPRPRLLIRLTRDEANDLIEPYRRIPIERDGVVITYVLADATVRDDDLPGQSRYQRRLRIDAAGVITLHWHSLHVDMPVRHLVGHLAWTFHASGRTLIPDCAVTVDSVEADAPKIPFMPDPDTLWRSVETHATRSLGKHLARHPIPIGSPIEAVVDVQIGDGSDVPIALPRIAHPLAEL